MNSWQNSAFWRSFVTGLLSITVCGCSAQHIELDVVVDPDWTSFEVTNRTSESLQVNAGLLDSAKSPEGDLYLHVRDGGGAEINLCGIVDTFDRPVFVSIEPGEYKAFREDTDLLRAVYCIKEGQHVEFSVQYRTKTEVGTALKFESNAVPVDIGRARN